MMSVTKRLLPFLQLDEFDDFCILPRTSIPSKDPLNTEERRVELQCRLQELKGLIRLQLKISNALYHPLYGSLFKAGLQDSRFAKQVSITT